MQLSLERQQHVEEKLNRACEMCIRDSLKVTPEQYETLDKEWILKEKEESYGYACLTNQKQYYMENWPQIAVEKGSVDQVMICLLYTSRCV